MPDHEGDDDFWNLLAAYLESACPEDVLRNMDASLVEAVLRHVNGCEICQAQRKDLRDQRKAHERHRNEGP